MFKNLIIGCLLMVCGVSFGAGVMFGTKYGYDNLPPLHNAIDSVGCTLTPNLDICK